MKPFLSFLRRWLTDRNCHGCGKTLSWYERWTSDPWCWQCDPFFCGPKKEKE